MIEEKIYNFNSHGDHRGELVALEYPKDLPFPIKRIYYIYNVPGNERRGFHSHNKLEQILIAVSGSVKILLKTPEDEKTVLLDSPKKGLYIGPMMWREMFDFSDDAVLLVLASREYDESDYIRNYEDYVKAISNMKGEGKND
jgi:dTDP-4-dehydrorhamnose 3,5-epimerase-like enzyme